MNVDVAQSTASFLATFETISFSRPEEIELSVQIASAVQADNGRFSSDKIVGVFVRSARSGLAEVVKLFLTFNRTLVNVIDSRGETALIGAAYNRFIRTVKILIDAGADVNQYNRHGTTALLSAIPSNRIIDQLLAAGADIDATDRHGQTLFLLAVLLRRRWVIDHLVTVGANLEKANPRGDRPLHIAARGADAHIVDRLLVAGVNVDVANVNGETPLYQAIHKGNNNIVVQLLVSGAQVTPNIIAAASDSGSAIRPILKRYFELMCLINIALLLRPLNLPVLATYTIFRHITSHLSHTVSRYCAWNLLATLKHIQS